MSTTVVIRPGKLAGAVTPPPSKSQAHRLIIAAALARGESRLENVDLSQDIRATLSCMEALGARWSLKDRTLAVQGFGGAAQLDGRLPRFDCGESGSTLRFLIPIALAAAGGGVFTGHGRLMQRPQKPYFDLFRRKGIFWEQRDGGLTVRGRLTPGEYALPGDVSSQFITGLLYALPLVEGESAVTLTTPLESRDYVSMTLQALDQFGVSVQETASGYRLSGPQAYVGTDGAVETDWSQAAFWYGTNLLGGQVEILNLNRSSAQGDMRVVPYSRQLARPGDVELDVSQCPDLVPPLAAMAAVRTGECRLVNAARLRLKESDRLATVTQTLRTLGAAVEEGADSLTFHGLPALEVGAAVDCCNDHRIAMMAAVAACACRRPVTLLGAECVNKSYPGFWEDYRQLGGDLDVLISG